jgi:hypothetical protein
MRDCDDHRRAIFLIAVAGFSKLPVDDGDRQPTGVIGLDPFASSSSFCSADRGWRTGDPP